MNKITERSANAINLPVRYNQLVERLFAEISSARSHTLKNRIQSVSGINTIQELQKRFRPEAARNVTATYLFAVRGQDGSMVLTKINDGEVTFEDISNDANPNGKADCVISVSSDDLKQILDGSMTAMQAALSGVLAIEGELGLAMQLVPIFFDGQVMM